MGWQPSVMTKLSPVLKSRFNFPVWGSGVFRGKRERDRERGQQMLARA